MKRLMVCLILLMLPSAALANGWNAPGGTVELFQDSGEYDAYTCIAEDYAEDDAGSVQLVMHSSDHNQLICAEQADGHWVITDTSTKAVYQPGKGKADEVGVTWEQDTFTLCYPGEKYTFHRQDGVWTLQDAVVGHLSFSWISQNELLVSDDDDGDSAIWQVGAWWDESAALTLEEFNISLFPHYIYEIRRINELRAILADGAGLSDALHPTAVAAATRTWLTDDPDASQYPRADIPEGAALTALDVYDLFYAYVETTLDGQTVRGFVPLRDLRPVKTDADADLIEQIIGAWSSDGSQMPGAYIELGENGMFAGSAEGVMPAFAGSWYMSPYAEELFDGTATHALTLIYWDARVLYLGLEMEDDTMILHTPQNPVIYHRVEPVKPEIQWDMMAKLAGSYAFLRGGSMLGDGFTLNADGTIEIWNDSFCIGTWTLTRYNPVEGFIWNTPEYTINVALDDGYTDHLGCVYTAYDCNLEALWDIGRFWGEMIELTDGMGGGAYMRVDDDYARSDVALDMMAAMAGNYEIVSGDALLTSEPLRLHPEGYFYSEGPDIGAMFGYWLLKVPEQDAPSFGDDFPYLIRFFVDFDSPLRAGEALTYGCRLTLQDDELAEIVITDGEACTCFYQRVASGQDESLYDMMAKLAGSYEFFRGSAMLDGDRFTLNADGTMVIHDDPPRSGTWTVTSYNPREGYIWAIPECTVNITLDDGSAYRRGCIYTQYDYLPDALEITGQTWGEMIEFTDGLNGGGYLRVDDGYARTDVALDMMAAMAGKYGLVSGDTLLTTGALRLHSDGEFYSREPDIGTVFGYWLLTVPEQEDPSFGDDFPYLIRFFVDDDSPLYTGEVLAYGCRFTSQSDEEAQLVVTDGEASTCYVWKEPIRSGCWQE